MFRELARKKQMLGDAECIGLLESERRGVLAVNGEDGYPYSMPMNHYYNAEDGCIYFHCGRAGHRLDSLRRSDKVSYCVCEKGSQRDGEWAYDVRSVVVFGRVEILDDIELTVAITTALSRRFTSDEEYIANEISRFAKGTLILKLTPEHIRGKRVNEA